MDENTNRPELPELDAVIRRANLPPMTKWRWLNGMSRQLRWFLDNPEAALALAVESERLATLRRERNRAA